LLCRAGEAHPFERPHRRQVVPFAHSKDCTHTAPAQRPGDQRAGSLRREASPAGGWNDAIADLDKAIGIRPAEEAGVADHRPGLALDDDPDAERLVTRSERRLPREKIDQLLLRPIRGQLRTQQLRGVLAIER